MVIYTRGVDRTEYSIRKILRHREMLDTYR